ncbi:MAG: hypothetical protein NTY37_07065, partial [Methanothrix sp.]|nr:hypothetical protein [Methanothrix sp.]
ENEIMQANRELAALDGIMQTSLPSSEDMDKRLADALPHLIAGMGGAQVGGVFLREESGLVLRALHGSVEELIEFIKGMESFLLLGQPRVHRCEAGSPRNWMSAPIICAGEAKGAVVVACADENGTNGLNFLEKAAGRIGHLLNVCGPNKMVLPSKELLAQIKTSSAPG